MFNPSIPCSGRQGITSSLMYSDYSIPGIHSFTRIRIDYEKCETKDVYYNLALIKRAGGLYGRILTAVCTHDRGQDSPIQTDLAVLIRCLLYGENKNNLIRLM